MLDSLLTPFIFIPLSTCVMLTLGGFLIRQSLLFVGQNWVVGYHHLVTYLLLPNIAFVISTVIANNIALSLGMIGALSIVRFRNPVKSPLELVMFFALLTLGVAASVQSNYSFLLFGLVILIIIFAELYNYILKKFGFSAYQISFNEGVSMNTLDVTSENEISFLSDSKNLKYFTVNEDRNKWDYRLAYTTKNFMEKDILRLKDKERCSIQADFNF